MDGCANGSWIIYIFRLAISCYIKTPIIIRPISQIEINLFWVQYQNPWDAWAEATLCHHSIGRRKIAGSRQLDWWRTADGGVDDSWISARLPLEAARHWRLTSDANRLSDLIARGHITGQRSAGDTSESFEFICIFDCKYSFALSMRYMKWFSVQDDPSVHYANLTLSCDGESLNAVCIVSGAFVLQLLILWTGWWSFGSPDQVHLIEEWRSSKCTRKRAISGIESANMVVLRLTCEWTFDQCQIFTHLVQMTSISLDLNDSGDKSFFSKLSMFSLRHNTFFVWNLTWRAIALDIRRSWPVYSLEYYWTMQFTLFRICYNCMFIAAVCVNCRSLRLQIYIMFVICLLCHGNLLILDSLNRTSDLILRTCLTTMSAWPP